MAAGAVDRTAAIHRCTGAEARALRAGANAGDRPPCRARRPRPAVGRATQPSGTPTVVQ